MSDDDLDIDPLEVLREDLADDAVEIQLDAVRNLKTIVLALGSERTIEQLIPFLDKQCFPIDAGKSPESYSNVKALACKEEVLKQVAASLNGELLPHIGGSESAISILNLLEKLAMVEETVIREQAVSSMISMAKAMDAKHVEHFLLPIVKHLADGDWWTSRFSAAGLAPLVFPIFPSDSKNLQSLLDILFNLCKDEMPMVRQQAYKHIPDIITELPEDNLANFLTPILKSLSKELQESIRNVMVDMIRELCKVSHNGGNLLNLCKQHFNQMVKDENWRVRKRFLEQLIPIANNSPDHFLNGEVLMGYVGRLQDTEPSVRVKAIRLLPEFLPLCNDASIGKHLTKEIVTELVKDEYPEVREAISASFLYIGPALKEVEVLNTLKAFSIDEQGSVRLNFCSALGKAGQYIGIDAFKEHLMPIVNKLHGDPKWRVRADIITNVTKLALLMGQKEFERSPIKKMLCESFKDPVSEVRQGAITQVVELVKAFKYPWIQKTVMPTLLSTYDPKNKYLHRMVPVKAALDLVPYLTGDEVSTLLPVVLKASRDGISNVRLLAVQALNAILPKLDSDIRTRDVRPMLEQLVKDLDYDVRFFAAKTLNVPEL